MIFHIDNTLLPSSLLPILFGDGSWLPPHSGNGVPHNLRLPWYESAEYVLKLFPSGISPSSLLSDTLKTSRNVKATSSWGMCPDSKLEDTSKLSRWDNMEMDLGMRLVRRLWERFRPLVEINSPIHSGISPSNALFDRSKYEDVVITFSKLVSCALNANTILRLIALNFVHCAKDRGSCPCNWDISIYWDISQPHGKFSFNIMC